MTITIERTPVTFSFTAKGNSEQVMAAFNIFLQIDDLALQLNRQTDALAKAVDSLTSTTTQRGISSMASPAMTKLTEAVARDKTVKDGAVTLLQSLAQQIRDNVEDPEALNKLADDIDASTTALGDAVVANTPAAP